MFSLNVRGSTKKTEAFLEAMTKLSISGALNSAGRQGVAVLSSATPEESGLTANSWRYEISDTKSHYSVSWYNSDVENGFPVAIMLQYGYGTGTGGYVQGRDYINPAIRPIMDALANDVWKVVTSA